MKKILIIAVLFLVLSIGFVYSAKVDVIESTTPSDGEELNEDVTEIVVTTNKEVDECKGGSEEDEWENLDAFNSEDGITHTLKVDYDENEDYIFYIECNDNDDTDSITINFEINKNPSIKSDWEIQTIDDEGVIGLYNSMDIDSDNNPHISYNRDTRLKYIYFDGEEWKKENIDDSGIKIDNSILLDDLDRPHISYYSRSTGFSTEKDLKYIYFDGDKWNIETMDSAGNSGKYNSITMDSFGTIYVSYYDAENKNLRYVYRNEEGNCGTDNNWKCETLDEEGDVGQYTSLTLDKDMSPRISYYDYTKGDLKFIYYNDEDEAWDEPFSIDVNNIGKWSSIKVDSKDNTHITFYDATEETLNYTYHDGTDWINQTIDTDGNVGQYNSLFLDSDDAPHVSYYDFDEEDLKYAYYTGERWNTEVVDSVSDVGKSSTLILDSNGIPHISYYDESQKTLKYAKIIYPEIISVTPEDDSVLKSLSKIIVETNMEVDECRGNETDIEFDEMKTNFEKDGKIHTLEIDYDKNGDYKFYIKCETNHGNQIGQKIDFEIKKDKILDPPKETIKTDPKNEEEDVAIDAIVSIDFTDDVDKDKIEETFDIDPDIKGVLTWEDKTFMFIPNYDFEYDEVYTISFDGQAFWFKTVEKESKCGDDVCSKDEGCEDCEKDCGCEDDEECKKNECVEAGSCTEDDDCSDVEICENDECTLISENKVETLISDIEKLIEEKILNGYDITLSRKKLNEMKEAFTNEEYKSALLLGKEAQEALENAEKLPEFPWETIGLILIIILIVAILLIVGYVFLIKNKGGEKKEESQNYVSNNYSQSTSSLK